MHRRWAGRPAGRRPRPLPSLTQSPRAGSSAGRSCNASVCQTSSRCPAHSTAGHSAAPWAALQAGRGYTADRNMLLTSLSCSCSPSWQEMVSLCFACQSVALIMNPAPLCLPLPPPSLPSCCCAVLGMGLTDNFISGVEHGGVVHVVPHVGSGAAIAVTVHLANPGPVALVGGVGVARQLPGLHMMGPCRMVCMRVLLSSACAACCSASASSTGHRHVAASSQRPPPFHALAL